MRVANGAKAFTCTYSLLVYLPQEKATIPETHTAPQKMASQKETSLEKTSIFRGYVSFRVGNMMILTYTQECFFFEEIGILNG